MGGGCDGPACWAEALWTCPHSLGPPHLAPSIIRGVNQDRFIQRAIEAANAYGSILRAVQAAEGAADQALQQAGHTWTVRPTLPSVLAPQRSPCPPQFLLGGYELRPVPMCSDGGEAGPGTPSPGATRQQQCPGRSPPQGAAAAGPW